MRRARIKKWLATVMLAGGVATAMTFTFTGCHGSRNASVTSQSAVSQIADSVISAVNAVLNDTERSTALQSQSACNGSRYSPPLGSADCGGTSSAKTVTATYAGCTAGPSNEVTLAGSAALSFDAAATCDSWISNGVLNAGSVSWTTTSFGRTGALGSVAMSSESHKTYQGVLVAGGAMVTFAGTNANLAFFGLHRMGALNGGLVDHSLRSTTSLAVSGTKANANRQIQSGTITIDDNANGLTAFVTITNAEWASSDCCYPRAGTLTVSVTGSKTGTGSVTFAGVACGRAAIVDFEGKTSEVILQSCE